MRFLSKLLNIVEKDSKIFQRPDINFILGLTTTQIKELKKFALSENLISEQKREFTLTIFGKEYLNENPIISWTNEENPKCPKINLEYLKIEKAPPILTKAIRLLAKYLLEGGSLKENSTEHYLIRELLCSKSACNEVKKEIEDFVLQENKFKLTGLFEKFLAPPYGLTKSIVSVLLLDVLSRNRDVLAIYENLQFQLKLAALMFDRMMYCPQNFEIQKTVIEDLPILEAISETILPSKSKNILDLTKGLIHFIKRLDKYTLSTERLSKEAIRFRNVILNAKDPINLFFRDIPLILENKILCQCDDILVEKFSKVIDELRNAYPNLVDEIQNFLFKSFKEENRANLARRFESVKEFLSENELKILHNNVKELNSNPDLWIERIATFINKSRVPKDWSDNDVADFKVKVKDLTLKFTLIEASAGGADFPFDIVVLDLVEKIQKLSDVQKKTLLRKVVNG